MDKKYSILCVDDENNILKALQRTFFNLPINIHTALSGKEGLDILEKEKIDLIITDYRMPEMDGIEFLKKAIIISPETERIMLSGYSDLEVTIAAINEGAIHKYITKPWDNKEFSTVVMDILNSRNKLKEAEITVANVKLNKEMQSIADSLCKANIETIKALMNTIELKDKFTRGHCERVMMYALLLADKIKLKNEEKMDLKYAALLHDIGNISMPEHILNKKGALTPEEREIIEHHPIDGAAITMGIDFLIKATRIILEHHERYDGTGYPHGLKGEELLVETKILSIVDVYDALTSDRSFRPALSEKEAESILMNEKGRMFDPEIVDIFLEMIK